VNQVHERTLRKNRNMGHHVATLGLACALDYVNAMSTYELKLGLSNRPGRTQSGGAVSVESSQDLQQSMWAELEPELARMIRAMHISADRADDVLQDVYLLSWRNPPKLESTELRR